MACPVSSYRETLTAGGLSLAGGASLARLTDGQSPWT